MSSTQIAVILASSLPSGPLEIPAHDMERCKHTGPPCFCTVVPTTDACFVSPFAHDIKLHSVPVNMWSDGDVKIRFAIGGCCKDDIAALEVARCISSHMQATATIWGPTGPVSVTVPLSSDKRLVARMLVPPHLWAGASSIVIESLTFAGRPMLCDLLPATAHVGFEHAPAPAGEVYYAAARGDVQDLIDALGAGGSIEEADEVVRAEDGMAAPDSLYSAYPPTRHYRSSAAASTSPLY